MFPSNVDHQLAELSMQLVAPDATSKLRRHDNAANCLDRSLHIDDVDNLQIHGTHVRQGRQGEFDHTPDSSGLKLLPRPNFLLAATNPGKLFRKIERYIPSLWVLVSPDPDVKNGTIITGVWRGKAPCATIRSSGELLWKPSGKGLEVFLAFCKQHNHVDAAAHEAFTDAIAKAVMPEYLMSASGNEGMVN